MQQLTEITNFYHLLRARTKPIFLSWSGCLIDPNQSIVIFFSVSGLVKGEGKLLAGYGHVYLVEWGCFLYTDSMAWSLVLPRLMLVSSGTRASRWPDISKSR